MKTFIITEKHDLNERAEGYEAQLNDLETAKQVAERSQSLCGTVMTIEHGGRLVAFTDKSGKWYTPRWSVNNKT
jgi:hypothetical protein